jgi:hypothetical protein
MIAIKLAFYSLLFLALVTVIAGPWFALAAFIALVIYGVIATNSAKWARIPGIRWSNK